jgi:HD superfamily phosphohydrolase
MTDRHIRLLLVSALLHDIGHWPFCHAIEDMRLDGLPRHETLANRLISSDEIAHLLVSDWQLEPVEVANVLSGTIGKSIVANPSSDEDRAMAILVSILSGPIDIDKIDYLERDSLHAGVPYGRNFDRHRLISSLCIDPAHHRLAITEKGRTAAEMMVFARYIMFSEVYWHHSVRSAHINHGCVYCWRCFSRVQCCLRVMLTCAISMSAQRVPFVRALAHTSWPHHPVPHTP